MKSILAQEIVCDLEMCVARAIEEVNRSEGVKKASVTLAIALELNVDSGLIEGTLTQKDTRTTKRIATYNAGQLRLPSEE